MFKLLVLLFIIKLYARSNIYLHGCFSHFLNCTNGTKSRKALQILLNQDIPHPSMSKT